MFSRVLIGAGGGEARRLAEALAAGDGELITAPGADLRAAALREDADLIVTDGPSRLSIAEPLPCPVAVLPRGRHAVPGAPRVVGVGFDASAEAVAALDLAERLAAVHGARLHVRIVAELLAPAPAPDIEHQERRARAVLHHALRRLEVPAVGDVVTGSPAEALQTLSQQVDLLITGAPAHAAHWPLLDASPPLHLLLHAGCPVLVVPRAVRRLSFGAA